MPKDFGDFLREFAADPAGVTFTGEDMDIAREEATRKGFEMAIKAAASLVRREGYPTLAGQIEKLQLVKKK